MDGRGFFPQTLEGWVTIILILGGGIATFWKGYNKLIEKLNGLGERVDKIDTSCIKVTAHYDVMATTVENNRREISLLRERVGAADKERESLAGHYQDLRIDIMSAINELKQAFQQRDTALRERLVRVETVTQLERKLGRPLTELEKE